jgi:hypothetical protein
MVAGFCRSVGQRWLYWDWKHSLFVQCPVCTWYMLEHVSALASTRELELEQFIAGDNFCQENAQKWLQPQFLLRG